MVRTREQLSEEIMRLEIEASKIMVLAGGNIYSSNQFPKYLKLERKIQKLRDQL